MTSPLFSHTTDNTLADSPVVAPPSKKKLLVSAIKKGLLAIALTVVDVAGYIFLGFIMSYVFPALTMPLYVFAAATAAVKLVLLAVKAIDPYHIGHLNKLRKVGDYLIRKYPKLPLIAVIFTIALSIFSQIVGCVAAGLLGVFFAIFISGRDLSHLDHRQRKKDITINGHYSRDIMTY